jgi:transposase
VPAVEVIDWLSNEMLACRVLAGVWLKRGSRTELEIRSAHRGLSVIETRRVHMSVIIGVDPHKGSHTAVAIDGQETSLGKLKVGASRRQVGQLLEWAAGFEERTWAVESAGGLGYLLSQQLVAAGETVLDVPATLAARVRLLGSGKSNKNDPNDALSVAVAALRAPRLPTVAKADHQTVLRLLAKRNNDLGQARNLVACRLHALLAELVPGGIASEISASSAHALLATVDCSDVVTAARHDMAAELLDDLRRLDTQMKSSKRRIGAAVQASGTSLLELFGVGPVNSTMIIGYTGDIRRFPTRHAYAMYNGTAPIDVSSGGRITRRLNRRGNRQLNHAIHIAAVTQLRFAHTEGRAYFDRKVAEGKTGKEALRALKRRISDAVYRQLLHDATR